MRRLREEFPDISISKIRYLEDEGLLTPRRTQGGYRLFSEADLERLQTILRLQRDEFLPLRVIKDELDAPGAEGAQAPPADRARRARRRRSTSTSCASAPGIDAELAKELEDFGLLAPHGTGARQALSGVRRRRRRDVRAARRASASTRATCARSAPRPGGRRRCSSSSSRRRCARATPSGARRALRDLQQLAELASELSSLLFWRDLRDLAQ